MESDGVEVYREEWSTVIGMALMLFALGLGTAWYWHGLTVSIALGAIGMHLVLGMILMMPDVEVYQYGKPPLQKWLEVDDDFE